MICPTCHQKASSFIRNAFTLQGVTFLQNLQGHFKCQYCGTLLRIVRFGKHFWHFYIPTTIILTLFIIFYRFIFKIFNVNPGIVWIGLVIAIVTTFGFGLWRYAEVDKVDDKTM